MRKRCQNPQNKDYANYGGRGIRVCDSWQDFETFYKWAAPRHKDGLQIDRINNDGNYSPKNCRFTTRTVNALNKRHALGASGVRGVQQRKDRWSANLKLKQRNHHLGTFNTIEEAIAARKTAEKILYSTLEH